MSHDSEVHSASLLFEQMADELRPVLEAGVYREHTRNICVQMVIAVRARREVEHAVDAIAREVTWADKPRLRRVLTRMADRAIAEMAQPKPVDPAEPADPNATPARGQTAVLAREINATEERDPWRLKR